VNITLRLAWRNLWRHRRRTWLTTGAMVFSNVLLVFVITLQLGTYRMMIDNTLGVLTGHIQLQAPGYIDEPRMRYTVDDVRGAASELRGALADVQVAARASAFALLSSAERSYGVQLVGVEPAREPGVSSIPGLLVSGRYLDDIDAAEIVIGAVLARNLQVGLGDRLTLLGSGLDGSFSAGVVEIVGLYATGMSDIDRGLAELPLGYFQDVFAMGDRGHSVVIKAASLDAVDALAATIATRFPDARRWAVHDWDALQPGLKQAIQADMFSAWFMYLVLVVLVAFSVLNTQLMSVMERTREFGIVLALGVTPGRLGRLVMLETTLMSLLGLVLGVALGGAVALWFGTVGFTYPGMEEMAGKFNIPERMYPRLDAFALLLGPAAVMAGCMLAGLIPALRLRQLEPVQAMRAAS
jgi:putative ABC transport system permease protein